MTTFNDLLDITANELFKDRGGYQPSTLRNSDAIWILDKIIKLMNIQEIKKNVNFTFKVIKPTIVIGERDFTVGFPATLFGGEKALPNFIKYISLSIIELLMIILADKELWNSVDLKKCLAKKLIPFIEDEIDNSFKIVDERITIKGKHIIGYLYHSNSCYTDSVLVPIYFSDLSFIRDQLLNINVNELSWKNTDGDQMKICPSLDEDMNLEEKREFASSLQKVIQDDYRLLTSGVRTTCSNFRNILVKCLPEMRQFGHWDFYNSVSLYTTLTDIFPILKIDVVEFVYNYGEKKWNKRKFKTGTLDVRDYITDPLEPVDIDQPPDSESLSRRVQWNMISSPILMLGHSSPIRTLNETGEERVGYRIGGKTHIEDVMKFRKIGETILDGRYNLSAVTVLHGVRPGMEGGVHYTSYFKGVDQNIYSYDDVSGYAEQIPGWPLDIFTEVGTTKPNLFFYSKST